MPISRKATFCTSQVLYGERTSEGSPPRTQTNNVVDRVAPRFWSSPSARVFGGRLTGCQFTVRRTTDLRVS